jgi:hypothetical protein
MAITTSGTITFQQVDIVNGSPVRYNDTMHIPHAKSLGALRDFVTVLSIYTDAAIVAISFSTEETVGFGVSGETPLSDMATLLFHGEHGEGKTPTKNLAVFSAKEGMFEMATGQGLVVTREAGNDLAAAYSDLTGETFQFIRGRLQR